MEVAGAKNQRQQRKRLQVLQDASSAATSFGANSRSVDVGFFFAKYSWHARCRGAYCVHRLRQQRNHVRHIQPLADVPLAEGLEVLHRRGVCRRQVRAATMSSNAASSPDDSASEELLLLLLLLLFLLLLAFFFCSSISSKAGSVSE